MTAERLTTGESIDRVQACHRDWIEAERSAKQAELTLTTARMLALKRRDEYEAALHELPWWPKDETTVQTCNGCGKEIGPVFYEIDGKKYCGATCYYQRSAIAGLCGVGSQ